MRYLTVEQYVARAGVHLPRIEGGDDAGDVDTVRIEAALDDASAECRAWLPDDFFGRDGTLLTTVERRVADVLLAIVYDIALYRLSDGATGAEDPISQRYRATRTLLREGLKETPERPEVEPELVSGYSGFVAGEAPEDDKDAWRDAW